MSSVFAVRIRQSIEKNVNAILFAAMGLGFIVPGIDAVPVGVTTVLLAAVMFFSCTKLTAEDVREVSPATSAWFLVVRFLVMPVLVFYALQPIGFTIALGCALIMLAPTAVIAPALTGLLGGNVAFSLLMTMATHLVFIFVAPFYLSYMAGEEIPIDSMSLLLKLAYMIIVPVALFALLRVSVPKLVRPIRTCSTAVSVLAIAMIIAILVARVRYVILADPMFAVSGFFWMVLIFASNYLLWGWALGWRQPPAIRNAMAISSGANNPALMIVIAALYFPPEIQVLTVAGGEIVWILAIPVYRMFLTHAEKRRLATQT